MHSRTSPSRRRSTAARRQHLVAAVTAALLVTAAGCGPAAPPAPEEPFQDDAGRLHVPVLAVGMRFDPATIVVPDGTHLVIDLENVDGMPHDLVLPDGATSGLLSRGQTASVDVGVVTGPLEGWCSVQGHREAGMVLGISVD